MKLTEEQVKKISWLSQQEVEIRIKQFGYNELPSSKEKNIFQILWDIIKEPMIILLIICGTLYFILWDLQEGLILLSSIGLIILISLYQENKTEKALQALKDLSSPRALVIRNGQHIRIPWREVVKDDIIILQEGDKIPADGELLWGRNLSVDESLLTGESVPVRKMTTDIADYTHFRPGGDDTPFLFSGSLVVQGQWVFKVLGTGIDTEMGRIGKALESIQWEHTLLQKEIKRIVTVAFLIAVGFCVAVFLIYSLTRGDWIQWFLAWLTLAMGILPEEFPVVLTVFLALWAWRLSKKNVLTRNMHAVETLWACTVLCSDKTWTITENKMTVQKLFVNGKFLTIQKKKNIPETFHELIEYGILASKKDPFDPMEKALDVLWHKVDSVHIHNYPLIEEYPITKDMLALSHVWQTSKSSDYLIASKWAPEAIMDLCHLSEKEKTDIEKQVQAMAHEWLRILWVAKAKYSGKKLPKSQHDFTFEFIGLIWWIDPIRASVPQAVKECYAAGMQIIMITWDYPATAQHIAKEIWLKHTDNILTWEELRKLPRETLLKRIMKTSVIARVTPEEKLIIIDLLKANNQFVAMTWDGVNDAPALKSAHIWVAMGARWTDVARESSAIVLLDDNFASIVHGVRMGRRIFDNLKKAMIYIVSVHIPIAWISLIPVLMGRPIVLFPVHIVFMELLIDPACSVVFEAEQEESNIMQRKPRDAKEPLFGKRTLLISILQGLFALLLVTLVFKIMLSLWYNEIIARTATFITLITSNVSMILVNRSWTKWFFSLLRIKNPALLPVVLWAFAVLFAAAYIPGLQEIFRFTTLPFSLTLIAIAAWAISVFWFEWVKLFFRKKHMELLKN